MKVYWHHQSIIKSFHFYNYLIFNTLIQHFKSKFIFCHIYTHQSPIHIMYTQINLFSVTNIKLLFKAALKNYQGNNLIKMSN